MTASLNRLSDSDTVVCQCIVLFGNIIVLYKKALKINLHTIKRKHKIV